MNMSPLRGATHHHAFSLESLDDKFAAHHNSTRSAPKTPMKILRINTRCRASVKGARVQSSAEGAADI
jgi:hypothetical protein